jgi:hypothetical protein
MSPALLVTVAVAALSAGLALLMARFELHLAADVFALSSGVLGLAAFVAAVVSTVRGALALRAPAAKRR